MSLNPTFFNGARVFPVYFKQGQFAKNDPKLYAAGFEVVLNNEGVFLQPKPTGDGTHYMLRNSTVDDVWYQDRYNMGWIQADKPIVMDGHEMGDFIGHPTDWRGCHYFGLI